jgi:hypothetical protein
VSTTTQPDPQPRQKDILVSTMLNSTSTAPRHDLVLRPAASVGDLAEPAHRTVEKDGMVIEQDIAVPVRTGGVVYIDVYRPVDRLDVSLPVIVAWGAFGKHVRGMAALFADGHGVAPEWISEHTPFEAPDPAYWCAHGYAVAFADPRGTWNSPGTYTHGDESEAQDYHDLVEWLGTQAWSSGRVGISGVSYLARSAFAVAATQPPHLAAINACESFVDMYREFAFHGGIPETRFTGMITERVAHGRGLAEDLGANFAAHPLIGDDPYWASRSIDAGAITVPALVIASWGDQGLHTRGTFDAFTAIGSSEKWLRAHGRKKWQYYYQPENVERLRTFFDRHLKGEGPGLDGTPRVEIEVREMVDVGAVRAELEWPPARTEHRQLFLDAVEGTLESEPTPAETASLYDARSGRAVFDHTFDEDIELTGYMALRLWIASDIGTDADVFVAVEKIGEDGVRVPQVFYATFTDGPVAQGWLRASHRALDTERSTPQRPLHPHDREEPLEPGVPVPIDIEIWPSSTMFRAGEALRLIVAGADIYGEDDPGLPTDSPWPGHTTRNVGRHVLRAGGRFDSYLLVPVL